MQESRLTTQELVKMCAVAMAIRLVKDMAKKMVFVYLKKSSRWIFFIVCPRRIDMNPFGQHCSNKIFVIRR